MRLSKVTVAGKCPVRNSIFQWFQCTLELAFPGLSPWSTGINPFGLHFSTHNISLLTSKVLGINTPACCSSPVAANILHQKLGEFFGWIGLSPRAPPQLSAAA